MRKPKTNRLESTKRRGQAKKKFTLEHSPAYGEENRWLVRDPQGDAVEFFSKDKAQLTAIEWNDSDAHLVAIDWENAPEGADESHRGFYNISVKGSQWRTTIACGWHSDNAAADVVRKLRNAVYRHGIDAVIEITTATIPYLRSGLSTKRNKLQRVQEKKKKKN